MCCSFPQSLMGGDILQPISSAPMNPQSTNVQDIDLMMTGGSSKVCPFHITLPYPHSPPLSTQAQQTDKNTMWSGAGLNIDVDNLLTSPIKTAQTTTAPSMNQLAKGTTATQPLPHPPPTQQSSSFSSSSSFNAAAGPNYNVNTASLMASPPHPQQPVGMGMGVGGMGMSGGMGMGHPGMRMAQPGMGYGGYGNQPGMMPMYGGGGYQQPGMGMGPMGYGGMPPTMGGGNRPMGTQQKLM